MKKLILLILSLATLQGVHATPAHSDAPAALLSTSKFDTILASNQNSLYHNVIYKRRLDSIKKEVPLDYNEYVQTYIDNYTSGRRREEVGHIIGLAKYYFPIYEKAFRDAGIPEEIKYLSIVESELNPNAVSRAGATGPWQFMFSTGKLYGLNVTDYVDERCDPIQASYAAAAYIKDAYLQFGDWLLAIASYNCGKDNIARAIDKANSTDFWAIRQYLPVETRGYVPAYIAVSYVMNYYKRHKIYPQACDFTIKTDTVLVNKFVSFNNVSRVLGVSMYDLVMLNPAYKRQFINGSSNSPKRLIIPQSAKSRYASAYKQLGDERITTAPVAAYISSAAVRTPVLPPFHTVKEGETLDDIAGKYGIQVNDLKNWNHKQTNKAVAGERLKLSAELPPNTDIRHSSVKVVLSDNRG